MFLLSGLCQLSCQIVVRSNIEASMIMEEEQLVVVIIPGGGRSSSSSSSSSSSLPTVQKLRV